MQSSKIEDLLREILEPVIRDTVASSIAKAVSDSKPKTPKYGRLMSVSQIAAESGYSKHTIYQKNCSHDIPGAVKIGGKLMFETSSALEWIAGGCQKLKRQ